MDIAVNKIDEDLHPSGAYIPVKILLIPAAEMVTENNVIDGVIKDVR